MGLQPQPFGCVCLALIIRLIPPTAGLRLQCYSILEAIYEVASDLPATSRQVGVYLYRH